MKMVEVTPEALDKAGLALSGKGPVQMVNLLRCRTQADYGEHAQVEPCPGREAYYQCYVPALAKVAEKVASGEGFTVTLLGSVHATLVAPAGQAWDEIAIIEYPSFETVRRIVGSPEYQAEAAPHRLAALADWFWIAATKMDVPS